MRIASCLVRHASTATVSVRAIKPPKPSSPVSPMPQINLEYGIATALSKRTGAVAVKCGMTTLWDEWGARLPLTVLQIDRCDILQIKYEAKDGYTALQLGAGWRKRKNITKPMEGHYRKAGVDPKRKIFEFRVTPDAVLPLGHELSVKHFVPGQYVDVTGTSIGKGFQGVMKRWNFKGQPASHGASLVHRMPGSTGQRQDPGKVFKGKKMAGRLGGERTTIQNLKVYKTDSARNLLYVIGGVPGNAGGFVRIRDAVKDHKQLLALPLPFPTFIPVPGETYPNEVTASPGKIDPWEVMAADEADDKSGRD
eukprot:GILK01001710.1.p1 GENE.GILK01001710.1~~GILK01001710.1.p1  ORF type:complete len:309 (+),score=30.29 GILK01001710.1:58-984(+)